MSLLRILGTGAVALLGACGGAEALWHGLEPGSGISGIGGFPAGPSNGAVGGRAGARGGATGGTGGTVRDAGTSPQVDVGTPAADAGTPSFDAGAGASDAGAEAASFDAGAAADAGQPASDAGAGTAACSGWALSFDGVDDQASLARNVQDDFTLEAWIKVSSPSLTGTGFWHGNPLIYADLQGTASDFGTSLLNDKLAFGVGTSRQTTITSASNVTTGQWVHVAAVRSRSSGSIWVLVNGVVETVARPGVTARLDAQPIISLGANVVDGHYFPGLMDEVRIWNVARSSTSIRATMNRRLAGDEQGLVGYWRLDETSGTSALDLSARRNHATLGAGTPSTVPAHVVSDAPVCP